jgi:hypothetical protein
MRAAPLLVALACALVLSGEHITVQGAAIIEDHSSSWGVGGSLERLREGGREGVRREGGRERARARARACVNG